MQYQLYSQLRNTKTSDVDFGSSDSIVHMFV